MRFRLAILFGVLLLLQGVAIALTIASPLIYATWALLTLAAAWYGVYHLGWRDVERLARAMRGDDQEHPSEGGDRRLSARRDEVGDLARALEAKSAALATLEERLSDAEATIRQNEARYRDLFDANPHPMIVFDVETLEILAANDRAVTHYGFTRQQFLRMTVGHLIPEPMTGGATEALERMALDRERPVETLHRKRDGTVVAVEVASHRIRFAGRPAALAMCVDITLRKQVEAENRRRTEVLEALYATAREHAESLSLREVARSVVDAARNRFGSSAVWLARPVGEHRLEVLAACPCLQTAWERREVPLDPASEQAMHGRTAVAYDPTNPGWPEVWWKNEDGSDPSRVPAAVAEADWALALPLVSRDRSFGVLHVAVREPEALPFGPLANGRGHRSREESEALLTSFALQSAAALVNADLHEQLQRTAEILEQRVKERTAQLEEANRELEAFSYSVSHDLRAPLRAVDGFARLALMQYGKAIPEECRTLLESVRCGAAEMTALIHSLLEFSRSSRQALHERELDPKDLVGAVLDGLKQDLQGRTVDIDIGELPPCMGDPVLLKQVYANLLSNAVKFTAKRESARIEIGAMPSDAGTVYYVRDNGAGFDMARAQRLFGVFQRFHRSEDYPGTGIGLATVHRIIVRHGGRIWCESAPDQGTTFYFTLRER